MVGQWRTSPFDLGIQQATRLNLAEVTWELDFAFHSLLEHLDSAAAAGRVPLLLVQAHAETHSEAEVG